ncbi:MAG: FAD-dependent monooxygenase, partial [Actinobacteria bacterium]|nr:FAD-dependent monooxygenase [Actinomycetota bacterium]MCG2802417.1 FAD-dependent monooxygenase [Cellulomonas sp.]
MGSDYDAIIVGAGPAGSAAAHVLAQSGRNVLLVERGGRPGAKNMSGGRLYTYALEMVQPGLTLQAPAERAIAHEQITLLDGVRSVDVTYSDPAVSAGTPQSCTVLRSVFDDWFAEQAEAKGAVLAAGVKVDALLESEGRIIGVAADGDEITADLVIAADGANSLLGQEAGVHTELKPDAVGIGVKEVIHLGAQTIEERFGLVPGEGAARLILGGAHGVTGGGAFLYTNRDTVSFGAVFVASSIAAGDRPVHSLLQDIKRHPAIHQLVGDGTTVEYSAHLVPEAGWRGVPQPLHRPGFLMVGDAAGLVMNLGYTVRGMDLAILSGIAAARAAIETERPGQVGPAYGRQLSSLGLEMAMRQAARFPDLMDNERIFNTYPALAADMLAEVFSVTQSTTPPLIAGMRARARDHVRGRTLLRDGLQAWQTLKGGHA